MTENLVSKFRVEQEKLLMIEDVLGFDRARLMAVENKSKAFAGLSTLLFKPKESEIEIVYEEKRYEAFWHLVGVSKFEYLRKAKYKVPVEDHVKEVQLMERVLPVQGSVFEIETVDRCKEEYRKEIMVEALTAKEKDFSDYLRCDYRPITSTDQLTIDGAKIVNLEAKSSFLVREVLNVLSKPIKADEILQESVIIHELNLFFFPVYVFEYHWVSKNKKAMVSFNGANGEISFKATKIGETLGGAFTADDLFEMGKEIAATIIPGGGIAMMMGKKAIEMVSKKKN